MNIFLSTILVICDRGRNLLSVVAEKMIHASASVLGRCPSVHPLMSACLPPSTMRRVVPPKVTVSGTLEN